eukprot:7240400-Prorocentrum_lima.AAC.1
MGRFAHRQHQACVNSMVGQPDVGHVSPSFMEGEVLVMCVQGWEGGGKGSISYTTKLTDA